MKRATREGLRKQRVWSLVRTTILAMAGTFLVLIVSLPLFSQGSTGTITGGVYDQSGGVIVGATVTVTDTARGLSRTLTTTNAGQYVASNELPGTYAVEAIANGFRKEQQANVQLGVGETIRVDLKLEPGSQSQTVTVTGEAPQIDTTNATLGGVVNNNLISTLPVNGRNFMRLLALRAGSVQELGSGEGDGSQDQASYSGQRLGDNLTVIEGIANFNSFGSSMINQSNTSILSVDAISEYNLVTEGPAEYGWKGGGTINIGLKSGTNDFHGDGFALGRDGSWDAGDFFSGPAQLNLENFGGTVGGPIIKNKLFFFANYEGERLGVQDPTRYTIPSDVALSAAQDSQNELSMVNACNFIGRANVNPLSALIAGLPAGSCVPQPSSSSFENMFPFNSTSSTFFAPGLTSTTSVNSGFFKIDAQLNEKNHVDGMYFKSSSIVVAPSLEPAWQLQTPTPVWFAAGHWVYVPNSIWVNELTVGGTLFTTTDIPSDRSKVASAAWPNGYGIPTGVTNPLYGGAPGISVAPFTGILGNTKVGRRRGPEGNYDATDHVSYVTGKHSFKFGFDFTYMQANGDTYAGSQGNVNFKTLQNFLLGIPNNGQIFVGDATQEAHNTGYAVFGQDSWRIKPRLTLNLGLRWEYYTSPSDASNYIGNFYPNANPLTTPAIQQAGGPFPALYHPEKSNFAPRAGFAWDIKGNGRTVLRGGGGVYYNLPTEGDTIDVTPFGANFPSIGVNNSGTALNIHTPERFSVTASNINWNLAGPVFPSAVPTIVNGATYTGVTCTPQAPCSTVAVSPDMKTPFAAEWNVDVERALTRTVSLDVAYVGNHDYNMRSRNNINQAPFGFGWTNPTSGLPATSRLSGGVSPEAACLASAPNYTNCSLSKTVMSAVSANEVAGAVYPQYPYLQYITQQQSQWYSNYNGLQVTLTARNYHGLDFLAGYTRSSAKDFMTFGGWAGPFSQDAYDVSHDYGPSDQNVPNRFTFSTTYNVPAVRSPLQFLKGWQISGIVVLQNGLPWYPQDQTSDIQGTGEYNDPNSPASQTWNYSGPTSAFTSAPHFIPCFSNPNALGGCTSYAKDASGNFILPSACASAAVAPYAGNAQLQQLALAALTNLGCYVQNGGVLTPPAYGTFGNATRNLFHGIPYKNLDLAVVKSFTLKERYTAEFRAEAYNALNHPEFITATSRTGSGAEGGAPDPEGGFGFGCACQSASKTDGVLGTGGPRSLELGLKFMF